MGRAGPHLRPRCRLQRTSRVQGRHQRGRSSDGHRDRGRPHRRARRAARRGSCAQGRRELPDGYAITVEDLQNTISAQGESSVVGRGDIMLVRTGQLSRVRRDGWGSYAGGDAPGLSFTTAGWLHDREIAAIATDTWGFEVRPNDSRTPFNRYTRS